MDKMIDAGVNLTSSQFSSDLAEVITRAKEAGIESMLAIGCDLTSSEQSISLAEQYQLYCTAGVHPHDAKDAPDTLYDDLLTLLKSSNKAIAVGECGLDFNRDFSPRPIQQNVCLTQLQLAEAINYPVYLHERDAHDALFALLQEVKVQGVLHCFTGDRTALRHYLDYGLMIGITGWVCDERRGTTLQELIQYIPLDRLLLETDAPYLLPRTINPKPKSRRNEPMYLSYVAEQIARLKQCPISEVISTTTTNFKQLFVR
ncbi:MULTISPECIES: TatD family hydrolase [Pseudoalteromonas]|uniref:TatD family hydrolase n=1 Tax=Pseudoalteromonas TaxID=53246 RepID=UPI0015736925|nr:MULTISPECIES: TatD family hydrolase [Pseudoalteromonas]MBR8845501.1 YchF/TatD family DNA exonuclease [Pseudoalteromonas sp. JC3]NSY34924.1 YchF/TatD family DNA exonuclease [Pseudoalteromonas sp. JC28]QUI72509.1 YchF/TatD family DNA exonuclease [Pseudoalteromonas sp. M8]UDM60159.1 YchF/TatD family DNA exonuclease [Pseudoalteromonas piscicida]WJE08710.1 TatD family hydrolase [Pseudoalteromonas sp. JC3]